MGARFAEKNADIQPFYTRSQFHGRPELVQELTEELRQLLE